MDKDVSGLALHDDRLGDARVRASHPEHGRRLTLREGGEELGLGSVGLSCPLLVTGEEGGEVGEGVGSHRTACLVVRLAVSDGGAGLVADGADAQRVGWVW